MDFPSNLELSYQFSRIHDATDIINDIILKMDAEEEVIELFETLVNNLFLNMSKLRQALNVPYDIINEEQPINTSALDFKTTEAIRNLVEFYQKQATVNLGLVLSNIEELVVHHPEVKDRINDELLAEIDLALMAANDIHWPYLTESERETLFQAHEALGHKEIRQAVEEYL